MSNLVKSIRVALVPVLFFSLFACQKELSFNTGAGGGPSVNGVLKMKINGQQWVANKIAGASIMTGFINITGVSTDKKTFTITLFDSGTGTYELDQSINNGGAALMDSMEFNPTSYSSNQGIDTTDAGGIVVVTQIDQVNKTISGTFTLKLYRDLDNKQLIITEGVFDKLGYATSLPPSSSSDTFTVKIDGVSWAGKNITTGVALGKLFINATELTATKTVGLTFPPNITPGTYSLDLFGGTYIGMYNPTALTALPSESGTLTILDNNATTKRIRGTFEFKAADLLGTQSAQLTEGYFSVKTP